MMIFNFYSFIFPFSSDFLFFIFVQSLLFLCFFFQFFSKNETSLTACERENSAQGNLLEMVTAMKNVCDDAERETLDMILNFLQAMQLYKTYTEFYKTSNDFQLSEDSSGATQFQSMDMLKAFLSPEQQTMFETYKSLF